MNTDEKNNMHSNRYYYQITIENVIGDWIDCDEERMMEVSIEYYE